MLFYTPTYRILSLFATNFQHSYESNGIFSCCYERAIPNDETGKYIHNIRISHTYAIWVHAFACSLWFSLCLPFDLILAFCRFLLRISMCADEDMFFFGSFSLALFSCQNTTVPNRPNSSTVGIDCRLYTLVRCDRSSRERKREGDREESQLQCAFLCRWFERHVWSVSYTSCVHFCLVCVHVLKHIDVSFSGCSFNVHYNNRLLACVSIHIFFSSIRSYSVILLLRRSLMINESSCFAPDDTFDGGL